MTLTARIGLIVAMDAKGGIGYKGDLPWRLKGDLQRFKELTIQLNSIQTNMDQKF